MASNYIKVFNNLCGLLKRQLDGNAAEQAIESTRKRIKTVYDAAIQNGDKPVHPGFNDTVFTQLDWSGVEVPSEEEDPLPGPDETTDEAINVSVRPREGNSLNREYVPLPMVTTLTEAQTLVAQLQAQQAAERRRVNRLGAQIQLTKDKIKKMLLAEKTGRKYKARVHRRLHKIPPAPCWCGCGQMVEARDNGKLVPRRFKQGHIFKYLSHIVDVERGGKKVKDLPELLRKGMKWTRCKHCHRPIPTTDPQGRPIEENIGLACYRRVHKVDWPYEPVRTY